MLVTYATVRAAPACSALEVLENESDFLSAVRFPAFIGHEESLAPQVFLNS